MSACRSLSVPADVPRFSVATYPGCTLCDAPPNVPCDPYCAGALGLEDPEAAAGPAVSLRKPSRPYPTVSLRKASWVLVIVAPVDPAPTEANTLAFGYTVDRAGDALKLARMMHRYPNARVHVVRF